ncbi:DNA-(apurinic or apyrimidinic site) endonuclease 2 isoform X3 [Gastrolobium bilobum]|uniref:DNA-(apurinic or apyrimidinic site) endonuclease 2 isoform X3 n=1 Tax=Gastrolobium bilobum TaxID=150636 RepID=UPI002AB01763|nr:DNA-(apurinic or apyrimidinic site) endonuclease 2 isoform X3 [Gastrolobium bilobum]
MKIVSYNVNGLRQRIAQFGSLRNLLNSFDADIICFQETKLRRQEVTADLVMADGYESFFSCTRTSEKGRTGYSGVITFCRVKSAFSSKEVALPLAAEEGFTGLMGCSQTSKDNFPSFMEDLEEFSKDELLSVDSEGRCIVTDHSHFVLFNIYGPRAGNDDTERIQFKQNFYRILQKRWESLLHQGRRIFVVGDLNIAPFAIDRCDAGPDFDNNEFRRWFKSILLVNGGQFFDVFRAKHPDKREAYTCWPQNTGAEVFNFGSRIDHILCAGSCLHESDDLQCHSFIRCHVKECDILTQYKRCKPESTLRWKGGRSIKLEGSDHAPVFTTLLEIPEVSLHSTPSLSARYVPMVHGIQQTLVSVLMKRRVSEQMKSCKMAHEDISMGSTCERVLEPVDKAGSSATGPSECHFSPSQGSEGSFLESNELSKGSSQETVAKSGNEYLYEKPITRQCNESKKKARNSQWSQLSLRSFFQKSTNLDNGVNDSCANYSNNQAECSQPDPHLHKTPAVFDHSGTKQYELDTDACDQDFAELNDSSTKEEKSNVASLEWQRIQQLMQNSIPLCKGHKEPCIARVVKKQGPNFGRRFYVCARAEGPASNPEANCGYFKWAASKSSKSRNK